MKRLIPNKEISFQIVLLVLVSAAIYLSRIGQLQYYKDDWYYVLDGIYGGPGVFNQMFAIDRPARGPFFQAYFSLFGANPLPYHLGHYVWRLSAALAALWLFRMIWPEKKRQAFLGALFFIIYPGYLWWTSGIEYQPMVASLCLQVLSFALTVKVIVSPTIRDKIIFGIGSVFTGWGYLALVDYAIGMEFFRLAIIFVMVNRDEGGSILRKAVQTIKVWLLSAFVIPASFLFWKVFLFTSERKVTDLGAQMGPFLDAPRLVLKQWLVGFIRDGLTVSVMAWAEPFSRFFWNLSLNEIIIGLIFAGLLLAFVFTTIRLPVESQAENGNYEPLVVGALSCFAGVIPVVIANRYVDFGPYSHYSLPVSLGAALFLASLVSFISPDTMRWAFVSMVVVAAALTHYALATSVIREVDIINSFWWQVYWRAPGIRAGTTLAVDYPGLGFDDQTDNIWGPANLLYFPADRQQIPVYYQLAALPLRGPEMESVLTKGEFRSGYRTHYFRYNKEQILVLSQPVLGACVRILDGKLPLLSSNDTPEIRAVVPYSKLDRLIWDVPARQPSPIFGKEPAHNWCYYFEKVDLAIQQRDRGTARSLADQALAANLSPQDPVEWMPFLLTYIYDNDLDTVTTIAKHIKKDENIEKQICEIFLESYRRDPQLTPEMTDRLQFLFCPNQAQ